MHVTENQEDAHRIKWHDCTLALVTRDPVLPVDTCLLLVENVHSHALSEEFKKSTACSCKTSQEHKKATQVRTCYLFLLVVLKT
jgi:hypothetical protein